MRKILHVSFGGLGRGGVSSVIFSIVKPLYQKFNFECVVFKKKCEREEEFLQYGKLHRINCYTGSSLEKIFRNFIMYKSIYKICKENKYDVIHVHNQADAGIVLKAAKKAGVNVRIAHSHNTASPKKLSLIKKLKQKRNIKLIEKYATKKLGCSKKACEDFYLTNDFTVVYNSVDLNKFSFKNKQLHEGINFVHVGRYCYQKNQTFILKVFKIISEQLKNTRLTLIGFGEDEEIIKKEIKELNLEKFVTMASGNSDFIASEFAKSDCMIFPSNFEGFGIVLIEAQASGCYCFCSEAIQDEADCGLIKKLSLNDGYEVWANEIINYINSKNDIDYKTLTEKLKQFDEEVIANQYAKFYS